MPAAEDAITVAVLVRDAAGQHPAERRAALAEAIGRAPTAGLLVLPYLAAHPPFWRRLDRAAGFRHAERDPHPSLATFQAASRSRDQRLLASVYEALGEGVFYALAQVTDANGEHLLTYRQWHAVNLPGWHERLYFQPGSGDDPPLFECHGLRVGLLMGGDLWVPEAARLLRLAGAEALIALSASPYGRSDAVQAMARSRAIENGIPIVLADRGAAPEAHGVGSRVLDREPDGEWAVVMFYPEQIRVELRRDDPLLVRRPRLYAPLSRHWESSAT